jgi:hypothetical protein
MKPLRPVLLLVVSSLVACGGTPQPDPPPVKPPDPPPGSLYALVSTPKNTPTGKIATKTDELWVDKNSSVQLIISAKRLSPLAKKIKITVSSSGSHLSVTPIEQIVTATGNATFTVTVDSSINPATDPNPYFFVYGYPLGDNDRSLDEEIRLDYGWDIKKPPVAAP